jgi:hypothetical protein
MTELSQPRALRDQARDRAEAVLLERRAAGFETVDAATQAQVDTHLADVRALNARIAQEEAELERAGMSNPMLTRIRGAAANQTNRRNTPMNPLSNVYRPHGQTSYFRDLMRVQLNMDDTGESVFREAVIVYIRGPATPTWL